MASVAQAAYNRLVVGHTVELDFTFKSDAEAFLNLMRVTHHRQDKLLRKTGIVEKGDPKQSVIGEINYDEAKERYLIKLSLGVRKQRDYGILSMRIINEDGSETELKANDK